jgi:flavin reductase (DIM6/NTAB) family NADH-FMN oxidoreductase RutF
VMAVGWTTTVSFVPPMLLVGIDGGALTCANIRKTKEFVVALPHEGMAREVLFAGTHHGRKTDKFKETGLRTQAAAKVKAPLIADAVANFECKLVEITRPGDCPLIVGRIVAAHENGKPRLKRLYYWYKGGFVLKGVKSR